MDYHNMEWEWVFLKTSRDINTYHAEFGKDVKFRCKRMKAGDPKLGQFLQKSICLSLSSVGQHLACISL